MAKRRTKAMTRDTMISMLRTRGVKGRLSKMTKPQLRKLLDGTAPRVRLTQHARCPKSPQ